MKIELCIEEFDFCLYKKINPGTGAFTQRPVRPWKTSVKTVIIQARETLLEPSSEKMVLAYLMRLKGYSQKTQ